MIKYIDVNPTSTSLISIEEIKEASLSKLVLVTEKTPPAKAGGELDASNEGQGKSKERRDANQ
jgi:hypothetical protein